MARVSVNYSSFTAGELSPRLRGRTDLAFYGKGCKTLSNMYILPQGGATKRAGSYYIQTAHNSNQIVRLIPFVYSENDAYILELGHNYIRFYRNSGIVLTPLGTPYKINTPYSGSELFDLKFVQTADVIYISHSNYPIHKLSRYDHDDWTLREVETYGGPFLDQNVYRSLKIKPSQTAGTEISLEVQNSFENSDFSDGINDWNIYERGTGTVEVCGARGRITGDGTNYSGLEQYFDLDPSLYYKVDVNVYNYPVQLVISTTPSGGGDVYNTLLATGSNSFTIPISAGYVYIGYRNRYGVYTEVDDLSIKPQIFLSGHEGAYWAFTGNTIVEKEVTAENQYSNTISVDSGESFVLNLSGTWVAVTSLQRSFDSGTTWVDYYTTTTNISTEITEASDGVMYRAGVKTGDYTSGTVDIRLSKLDKTGWVEIDTVTNEYKAKGTSKVILPNTDATFKWSEGAWSSANGYPSSIAFYEQRLLAAGSPALPQTIWGSQVDDYENYEIGILDSDAYIYSLVSTEVNTIQWMLDKNYLLCGSLGGEWRFGYTDTPTTPTVVSAKRQTQYGSSSLQAKTIGHNIVYVQSGGTKLRSLYYDYRIEGFKSPDISQRSEHLLLDGIKDIAIVDKPDPLILLVTEEGDLVCCTFDPDNEVTAYSIWETDGTYESVSSIPSGERDEIWVVVKRTINGTDYRYIEQFQANVWDTLEDAFYVDSGLTYTGTATDTVSGLGHLEGKEVVALGDGSALAPQVVSGGSVTYDDDYSKFHIGLEYSAVLETMDIEAGAQAGTAQSKLKNIYDVTTYLLNSVGLKVGTDLNNLDEISFRTSGVAMNQPVPLFTGDKKVTFNKGFDRNLSVMVVNDQPLPFTVISLVMTLYTSDL